MEEYDRLKYVRNGGKLLEISKSCLLRILFSVPLFLEKKMLLSFEYGGTSHRKVLCGEKVRVTFLVLPFSQTPTSQNIQYVKVPYCEGPAPNPIKAQQ